ncbi:unnamed protein product [Musa acuminata subsp. burmannicoides]
MSAGRAAGSRTPQLPKRYLPFPYATLPFFAPDEYHRLPAPDGRRITGDELADALVIKTPICISLVFLDVMLKLGKVIWNVKFEGFNCYSVKLGNLGECEQEDDEAAESSEWMTNPFNAERHNNLFLTPKSGNRRKKAGRSKVAKYKKSGPQAPMSNPGSPSCNTLTSVGTCHYDSSLGDQSAEEVANVLVGIGLLEKKLKNKIRWKGQESQDNTRPGEVDTDISVLQVDVENFALQEYGFDDCIRSVTHPNNALKHFLHSKFVKD